MASFSRLLEDVAYVYIPDITRTLSKAYIYTYINMSAVEDTACVFLRDFHSPQYQVGIDTLFYKTDTYHNFQGIKLIPPGSHLIHITDSINNSRTGKFVEAEPGTVIIMDLVHPDDTVDNISIEISTVSVEKSIKYGLTQEIYVSKMTNYQNSVNELEIATTSIMQGFDYSKYLSNNTGHVTSEDATTLEVRKLDEAIMRRGNDAGSRNQKYVKDLTAGLKILNKNILKMSVIDLTDKKTLVRTGSANKMQDYMDRTWIIEKAFGQDRDSGFMKRYLAEFKFSFVLAAILNNQGAYQQWKTLLDLFLRSGRLLKQHEKESYDFMSTLSIQLRVFLRLRKKEDYEDMDDTFNVDLSELQDSFTECLLTVDELEGTKLQFAFGRIVQLLNSRFGMEISDRLDMSE